MLGYKFNFIGNQVPTENMKVYLNINFALFYKDPYTLGTIKHQ